MSCARDPKKFKVKMGSLHCISCDNELLKDSDLFLYFPVKNDVHLAIKFERSEHVVNEYGTLIECPLEAEEGKAHSVRVSNVKCKNCNNDVAFRINNGPNRDSLICISFKATFNILSDGSKLSNTLQGGAPARKKLLETFLEKRNITEFYGSKMTPIKSESLVGSLVHPTIDDLNSLKMNELVKDKPRSYQIECFCAAALFSSIIQIPTGSGKTHISVMLASLYKKLNPNRMIWFLTDRIPLVFQQARYIEEQTSLTVLPLAGDVQTSLKPSQLIKYDVLVCTVQLLINMLVIGQIRISDVSLVILDEVHHAVRNHPYVVFIETFLSQRTGNDRPRFLGLTASPAAGSPIQMKLQLRNLGRLCGAQLFTPCIYRDDLANAVNRPNTKFISVDLTSGDSELFQAIFQNIQDLLKDESCPCSNLEEVRMNLRGLTVKSRQDHKLASKLYKINQLLTALEMTSILGSRYSCEFLLDVFKPNCGDLEGSSLSPCEENIVKLCQISDESGNELSCKNDISPKLKALCRLLESIDIVSAPETRMIIFVETKRTARWLATFLQDYLTGIGLGDWNATAFVGQASNSIDGMSWSTEQRPILALFRTGHIKLLIATSVLQEGLDVAACNHIVLFDRTWSLKAFLQSRGRARAQDSKYAIICSADDQNYYEKLFQQEIILSKMVRDEMVEADVLSLELVMTLIHLTVKCSKVEFIKAQPTSSDFDESGAFGNLQSREEIEEEEDDSEYNLTLNLHNVQQNQIIDAPCQLNITEIERKRDHLRYFGDDEEFLVSLELPAITLKSIRRSWIQLSEELLDPLINERFPTALIELDRIIPELLIGGNNSNVPILTAVPIEMQRLALGTLDSGNKFVESASQHHSFTPTISMMVFEPLSRKINVLFQESLKETFRFEIAYDSIDAFCILSRNETENADSNFSLTIPVKTPPLLFVTFEDVSSFEIEKKIDEIYWERVTANSFSIRLNEVFSVCPSIKFDLFLNGMASRKLFQILWKIGSNILYTSKLQIETFPEYHSLWLMEIENFLGSLNDFELEYRLRSIISETWSKTSLRIRGEFLQLASSVSNQTIDRFIKKLATSRFMDPLACLQQCCSEDTEILEKSTDLDLGEVQGALSIKLVTWTPSRIVYHRPTLFLSNRVIREFGPGNFIRVHFRDEDFDKLSVIKANASIDNLLNVGVKSALDNGITIGGRRFEFLAMSSSQLRGHGCWFVDEQIGADKIRKWLGNFAGITNVAKYVARLGQSFSASRPTLSITTFDYVDDWEHNGHCFSDGCGMISPELAQEVAMKLNLSKTPSAYQIRFAGFKGVVAVYPEISSPLALRPSMKKFETHHRGLDILNIADAFPCFLNRQIIMILSALGVPDSSFETLQLNHLKHLAECFNSNGSISVKNLNISDLDPKDPFMRTLISAQYRQQLTELLTKTRIAVPQGRILMGVIDESGILAEDEIFCQIDDDHMNSVIEGCVMIAKNPCMHPGDVRVLKAIRSPKLESFSRNVIVFSRHGPRPIPNMCSGSDLDGDLYFVTWDQSLIPPIIDEPMNYEGLPASVKDGLITNEDLKEFMINFIRNDQLGAIANTHVAFADQLNDGVRDPACMALARLFSLAVDFPKTGFVAVLPKGVRIQKYPDFMQKLDKPSYVSHRIIGTLFREIKAVMNEEIPDEFTDELHVNHEFLIPGYEEYLSKARKLYEEYSMDVGQCLTQHGFRMESHLLMTCTIAIDVSIREMNSDALEIAELTFNHHVKRFQEIFDALIGNDLELRAKMASACYYVTYSDPITPMGLNAPILSFPWIIQNRHGYPRDKSTSLSKLIADDMKYWFIGDTYAMTTDKTDKEVSETNLLVDILSQKLSLLHQICGILDSSSDLKVCLREFLLTGKIILHVDTLCLQSLQVKILKAFPSANIKNDNDSHLVTIDSTDLIFQNSVIDRSKEFSSQLEYIKAYLCNQFGDYELEKIINVTETDADCTSLDVFDDLVTIEQIPKALRSWNNWILASNDSIYLNLTNGLLEALDFMICNGIGSKIDLLKIQHGLMRTCRIKYALSIANVDFRKSKGLQSRVIRSIVKNPRILRQIGGKGAPMGPTGNALYVQGAAKSVFIGSFGEGDLLRFDVYDGRRQLNHLLKVCYKVSLRSGQILPSDETFAFNEYWTHLHRQFHYLRKFGGPEYGKLYVSVKLGQIYATEIPRMFTEQPVSIWLARVALEKAFKSGKWGRKKPTEKSSPSSGFEMDCTQLKCNPRTDSLVDEAISSNRVTQSLESFLEAAESGNNSEEKSSLSAAAGSSSTPVERKKTSKTFGKMSTAFEPSVDEATTRKFLSMWKFERETTLHVSLVCYDESSNANTSLQVHYDIGNGPNSVLRSISQRPLRWAVVDVLSGKEGGGSFDSRISISSFNMKTEDLNSTIFSNCFIELTADGKMIPKVNEEFRSNPTIYARIQEGHSAVLRDDFSLVIRKISEFMGVDPQTGQFALNQDKWEVEAKMTLDWDEIHDYQYRDQLILSMWSISKNLMK